jgi:hypothetical protein
MAGQCLVDSLGQEIRDCNLQAVYGRHVLDWVVLWLMSPHFCLSWTCGCLQEDGIQSFLLSKRVLIESARGALSSGDIDASPLKRLGLSRHGSFAQRRRLEICVRDTECERENW